MKEIKIRFHHDDKGYCREYWEIFSDDSSKPIRFLIRDTSGPGEHGILPVRSFTNRGAALTKILHSLCAIMRGKNTSVSTMTAIGSPSNFRQWKPLAVKHGASFPVNRIVASILLTFGVGLANMPQRTCRYGNGIIGRIIPVKL